MQTTNTIITTPATAATPSVTAIGALHQQLHAVRHFGVPPELRTAIAGAPLLVIADGYGVHVEPDFVALFPEQPEDPDDYVIGAEPFTAAAASLLYHAAGMAFDAAAEAAGFDPTGVHLRPVHNSAPSLLELEAWLPAPICAWLADRSDLERASWLILFLADIKFHALSLAAGRFPETHSTGSELALQVVLHFAWLTVDELDRSALEVFIQGIGQTTDLGNTFASLERALTDPFADSDFDGGNVAADKVFAPWPGHRNPWLGVS